MMFSFRPGEDDEANELFRKEIGPNFTDKSLRQAIEFCWLSLPRDKRNIDELRRQMQRLLDRAMRDVEEDLKEFGL